MQRIHVANEQNLGLQIIPYRCRNIAINQHSARACIHSAWVLGDSFGLNRLKDITWAHGGRFYVCLWTSKSFILNNPSGETYI